VQPLIGPVVLLLTTAALLTAGVLAAASLRLRSVSAFLFAAYVIAWAGLVGLVALLSAFDAVERWVLVAGVAGLLLVAALAWAQSGRHRPPPLRPAVRLARALVRDPAVALLTTAVALGFAYVSALALFTPVNSIDALWYHLPRAAIWLQQHHVGYIANANDTRLNGNPPVAEIGMLYTMAVAGVDRFATLVSLSAYAILPLGVFGLARRLRVEVRPAALAGLAFATLPVLLLHASTAKNDLVLASFAVICTYFCLGTRRAETVLAGVAFALALGTKIFAPLFLPLIALVVLVTVSRRRALALAAITTLAVLTGAAWFFINAAHSGSATGDLSDTPDGFTASRVVEAVPIAVRYLIDFAEIPGAGGWWLAAYVVAVIAVGVGLLRRRASRAHVVAAALLVCVPFVVAVFGPLAARGYRYTLFALDRPRLGILDYQRSVYAADPMTAYFGPLGLALLLSPLLLLLRRRSLRPSFFVLAAAPFIFVVEISASIGYTSTSGRFYIFAAALAAAACSVFLTSRPVLWAVVALAVPTLALTLRADVEKPRSVWGEPRWRVQTHLGPNSEETTLIEYAAESLPRRTRLGLGLDSIAISYPFFDARLERRVRFLPRAGAIPRDIDWIVLSPRWQAPEGDWRVVVRRPGGWRLYHRA